MGGDEASFVLFLSLGELRICGIARLLNSFSWSTWAVRGFHTIVQKALVKLPIAWVYIHLIDGKRGWLGKIASITVRLSILGIPRD